VSELAAHHFSSPENGRSSPLDEPSPPPKSPVSSGGLQPPPGLSVSAVEQSLNDLEISGDVPLQRRKEVRTTWHGVHLHSRFTRGALLTILLSCIVFSLAEEPKRLPLPTPPPFRAATTLRATAAGATGATSPTSTRNPPTVCTHSVLSVAIALTKELTRVLSITAPSGGPSAISSSTPARSATPPATQPVSVPAPGSGGKGGKKGSQSQTHKRRSSNGVTAGQTGGSGAASGAGASGAANAQSFVIGTNTLGTRNRLCRS
jgi:hypothetical protein